MKYKVVLVGVDVAKASTTLSNLNLVDVGEVNFELVELAAFRHTYTSSHSNPFVVAYLVEPAAQARLAGISNTDKVYVIKTDGDLSNSLLKAFDSDKSNDDIVIVSDDIDYVDSPLDEDSGVVVTELDKTIAPDLETGSNVEEKVERDPVKDLFANDNLDLEVLDKVLKEDETEHNSALSDDNLLSFVDDGDVNHDSRGSILDDISRETSQNVSKGMVSVSILDNMKLKHEEDLDSKQKEIDRLYERLSSKNVEVKTEVVKEEVVTEVIKEVFVTRDSKEWLPKLDRNYEGFDLVFGGSNGSLYEMYSWLATTGMFHKSKFLLIDLSVESYLMPFGVMRTSYNPFKYLLDKRDSLSDVISTFSLSGGIGQFSAVTTSTVKLPSDYIEKIDWLSFFKDLEVISKDYTKVYVVLGNLSDTRLLDLYKGVGGSVGKLVFTGSTYLDRYYTKSYIRGLSGVRLIEAHGSVKVDLPIEGSITHEKFEV